MLRITGNPLWREPLKTAEIALKICIACRNRRVGRQIIDQKHVRSVPDEWKKVSQLDDLNLSELKPQYRHIGALENAPEPVRRIFTLKFGTDEEKYEALYLNYGKKLQKYEHDHDSLEMQIVRITIEIRKTQEEIARMLYEKKQLTTKLQSMIKTRLDLLFELRSKSFEKYCLVMKVLDLNVVYYPEHDVPLTHEANDIADMKLRSFAEIQHAEEERASREKEVSELQSEILIKLKSGEISSVDEKMPPIDRI